MKVMSYTEIFQFPQILSGSGTRSLLPSLVEKLGGKRPILYSDKGLTAAGLTGKIQAAFERLPGIQLAGTFDDIQPDTRTSDVNAAIHFFKEVKGDTLISLGGGSVQDTVKGIKWALENKVEDISSFVMGNVYETLSNSKPFSTPHIALPTTAGTGSEVSPGAVIYNENIRMKCNLSNPYIAANIAVLDPDLTVGLPASITAATGMDALTHAIEGYFSSQATILSDAYAVEGIKTIATNLDEAVHNGQNVEVRSNMLQASAISILSFCAAGGPYPVHNLAHALGARYHIPHGLANAVLLAPTMLALQDLYKPRIQNFANILEIEGDGKSDGELLLLCVEFIQALCEKINLPTDFKQFNLQVTDLPEIITAVHNDPIGMGFRIPEPVIEYVMMQVI